MTFSRAVLTVQVSVLPIDTLVRSWSIASDRAHDASSNRSHLPCDDLPRTCGENGAALDAPLRFNLARRGEQK